MSQGSVLVIDDEPDIRELLSITLKRMGIVADSAASFEQGIQEISQNDYFLVLTDMKLPDGDGLDIVQYIQKHKAQIPVAVITAYGNVESAVNTLKAGAFDYVSKPINLAMLKSLVKTASKMSKRVDYDDEILIGKSDVIQSLRDNIHKLARSQAPVFIHGESGVGKELVARLIHANGPRNEQPFIAVNCGAIPSELMESEFFGHRKGSFTGATSDKQGLFKAADGGTLFLDEVAELPLPMQVKLLRAIQEKAIKPVGEHSEHPIDVRILSASNKSLVDEIAEGRFRQELYYRINVIEQMVPPLRERRSDIPLLADNILKKLANANKVKPIPLAKDAMQSLIKYDFPGNVRELENILERAMTLCNGQVIDTDDLRLPGSESTKNSMNDNAPLGDHVLDLDVQLQEQEKELILDALDKTKWNRTKAAKLLGISFRTLRYRLKKLGLD